MTHFVKKLILVLVGLFVTGCGVTRHPLPATLANKAEIEGIPNVRDWGDQYSPTFQADLVESIREVLKRDPRGQLGPDGYVNVLALSGGGEDGAYGAGLLCGWTASGKRPSFKLVTGISTGSLIAPFAFVGPEYDETLKKFYTTIKGSDIYTERSLLSILGGADSMADTAPLAALLEKVIDEKLLAAVAKAHREGRRLYIGTTNLDAGRLTVWNMGVIANSNNPRAPELFREIMRASASIPVAFPPVLINVVAEGNTYDEMYVDGGASTQVFFYGFMLNLPAAIQQVIQETDRTAPIPPIRIFVIRNSQIKPVWKTIKPKLLDIAGQAASDLIRTGGIGDLFRIYSIAKRDGIEFNMAYIPDDFVYHGTDMFDQGDMRRLFDLAYKMAKAGYPWQCMPPGLENVEPIAPLKADKKTVD